MAENNNSKKSNSLSKTQSGLFAGIKPMGIMFVDDKLKPVGITVNNINLKLKKIQKNANLGDIQKLAILKDFNTAFIGYLRKKAQEDGNNGFNELFYTDKNGESKINDLKYSRLINGIDLNSNKFPRNNQIKTLKKNKKIKEEVCTNNQQNKGPVSSGTNQGASEKS